jgi:cysteine desulfurase
MVTLSSHKIEGPKGVGALWVSAGMIRNRGIVAQALGGGQEGGLRSGTENVPGIAAFGAAVRDKREHLTANEAHLEELRRYLIERATARAELAELQLNLPPVAAPHIVSITLPSIKSETMLHFLSSKGIYVSSGSACSSHDAHLSGAMLAWGLSEREADCTIRVSFGSHNTRADVDALLDALAQGLKDLIRHRG